MFKVPLKDYLKSKKLMVIMLYQLKLIIKRKLCHAKIGIRTIYEQHRSKSACESTQTDQGSR